MPRGTAVSEAGEDLHLGVGGEELGALPLHHGLLAALHAAEGGLGQVHDLELLAVGADRHHRHAEALDRAIAAQASAHCQTRLGAEWLAGLSEKDPAPRAASESHLLPETATTARVMATTPRPAKRATKRSCIFAS